MSNIRILFLAANPSTTVKLALDQECAAIDRELRLAVHRDLEFVSRWSVTVDELMRHFNEVQPTVVHFSGHGAPSESAPVGSAGTLRDLVAPGNRERDRGGIYLHDERGRTQFVTDNALAKMVKAASSCTRLVVLNACYTESQAEVVCGAVDCVVGMTGAILSFNKYTHDADVKSQNERQRAIRAQKVADDQQGKAKSLEGELNDVQNTASQEVSRCRMQVKVLKQMLNNTDEKVYDLMGLLTKAPQQARDRPDHIEARQPSAPPVTIKPCTLGDDFYDNIGIRSHLMHDINKFLFCYEKELKANPVLASKVDAEFFINPNGGVQKETVTARWDAGSRNSDLADCVVDAIKTITFLKPTDGVGA